MSIIISPMTLSDYRVTAPLITWPVPSIYPSWKLVRYSFMHGMSWASRPGRVYPSRCQSTTNVNQIEDGYSYMAIDSIGRSLHWNHWHQSWEPCLTMLYHHALVAYRDMEHSLLHCAWQLLIIQESLSTPLTVHSFFNPAGYLVTILTKKSLVGELV